MKKILQIVPRPPGPFDGVGDYALTLAGKLRDLAVHDTVFAVHHFDRKANVNGFDLYPLQSVAHGNLEFDQIILHYVNYGYHNRGTPFGLVSILSRLQRQNNGRFLTIFHELYASGPPWQSAFWLRPLQKRIATSVAGISDACVVSNETMARELAILTPNANALVHPVISNFGEPTLAAGQIAQRDPHRWAVCGGTLPVERSVRSFRAILSRIPSEIAPRELFIFGGNDNPAVRSLIGAFPKIEIHYRPNIAASDASDILSKSSFQWLDYFHRRDVPTDVLLKSTAFAAACAHGVIPVLPHPGRPILLRGDSLPGPFFVGAGTISVPSNSERGEIGSVYYNWYRKHGSSEQLVRSVADLLGILIRDDSSPLEVVANH